MERERNKNWGRSFSFLKTQKAHGWKLSCSSSGGTMITLGFIHHTVGGGNAVNLLPWRQNPRKTCNSSRNES
jgi:hypothetical protein